MPNKYIQRYKTAQYAKGSGDPESKLDNTTEQYIGRVEDKYDRLWNGQDFDAGHQKAIAQVGASFRKQTGLPRYDQPDELEEEYDEQRKLKTTSAEFGGARWKGSESEDAEPEGTKVEDTKSEDMELEDTASEGSESKNVKPEGTKSEDTESEDMELENTESEEIEADNAESSGSESDDTD